MVLLYSFAGDISERAHCYRKPLLMIPLRATSLPLSAVFPEHILDRIQNDGSLPCILACCA